MRSWSAEQVAQAAGARLVSGAGDEGPQRAGVDSRAVGDGDLFVGLPGANADGGAFAAQALEAGAWGALVSVAHADAAGATGRGVVLAADDPLVALQALARAWRRELGGHVVAITGSTGKTSTKDILAALLATRMRTYASPQNYNTEVGLPLALLAAPPGTEAVVVEMGMRGPGQIAELAAIAEPDVGVITNIGPVHLELLGSLEAIADAKAELLRALPPDGCAVVPAGADLLAPHLRDDIQTITFGPGGEVHLVDVADGSRVLIATPDGTLELRPSFVQGHNLLNLLAAVAVGQALGVAYEGALNVTFSALRGDRLALPGGVAVVNDCYNANPMSMRAALDDLAATARGRRVAVLGDMLELGPDERRFHEEVGRHAGEVGVDVLVAVGLRAEAIADAFPRETHRVATAQDAAALVPGLVEPGDTVLVKGSRGVGLEVVAETLARDQAGARGA